jgi:hypothetical protein
MNQLRLLLTSYFVMIAILAGGCASSSSDPTNPSASGTTSVQTTAPMNQAQPSGGNALPAAENGDSDRNAPEERDQLTSSLRGPRALDQRDIPDINRQSVVLALDQIGRLMQHGIFTCEEFNEKLNVANRYCEAGESHHVLNDALLNKCHNLQKSYNSYMMFCY